MQSTTCIKTITTVLFSICLNSLFSQTLSWAGYTQGAVSPYTFSSGVAPNNVSVVVTKNNVTQNDNTPKYVSPAFAATSGTPCYINGLALNAGTFQSYVAGQNANYTVTMTFNPANVGSINGTCNSATFSLRDINADEGFDSFLDVIEISAIDGNGNPIPTGNITTALANRVTRSNSGSTVRLIGHNSINETVGNYNGGQNCGDSQISITPGANTPLKSITIKYRPGYGTSTANAYYNINPRPAVQYVSISNIDLASVGICPVPLAIQLKEFNATRLGENVSLDWTSFSEQNNDYYTIESTTDGISFTEITRVKGAGNSDSEKHYNYLHLNTSNQDTYYRLSQTDNDGTRHYLDTKVVLGKLTDNLTITDLYPNPANDVLNIAISSNEMSTATLKILDIHGKVINMEENLRIFKGDNQFQLNTSSLQRGFYFIKLEADSKSESTVRRFIID